MITVDLNTPITKVNLYIPPRICGAPENSFKNPVLVTKQTFRLLYIYELEPIDYWFGSMSLKDLLQTVKNSENETMMASPEDELQTIDILTESFDHAAKAFGLRPDWRAEPRFSAVPCRELCFCLYGIRKLDNNGTTIVVSETPLLIDDPNGEQRLEVYYMQRFWTEKK
jgi:hypothetical protein